MAKKNYYAVRVGRVPGIYRTWEDCKAQTTGISGAQFKGFSSLDEAERFLLSSTADDSDATVATASSTDDFNAQVEMRISSLDKNESIAFVDGSYDVTGEKSAFGAIIFSHDGQ